MRAPDNVLEMKQQKDIIPQIEHHFEYLFKDYGFRLQSEIYFERLGNWVVLLQSQDCRLRFFQDRGEVLMAFSPHWSPSSWQAGPWFSLPLLLQFVTGEEWTEEIELGKTAHQFDILAEALRPHCHTICMLFTDERFPLIRRELASLQAKATQTLLSLE